MEENMKFEELMDEDMDLVSGGRRGFIESRQRMNGVIEEEISEDEYRVRLEDDRIVSCKKQGIVKAHYMTLEMGPHVQVEVNDAVARKVGVVKKV